VRILILGAGGFIGSNLTEHLLKETEHVVVGLDEDDEKTADIKAPADRFVFHKIDITKNQGVVDRLVQESDLVIDLIAYANPSVYVSQPLDVVDEAAVDRLQVCLGGCASVSADLFAFVHQFRFGNSLEAKPTHHASGPSLL